MQTSEISGNDKSEKSGRVLILGYGGLGGGVLDGLIRSNPESSFLVVGRDGERLTRRINMTRYSAYNEGIHADVDVLAADALEPEVLAAIIENFRPGLLFNATTLVPWWKIDRLDPGTQGALKEGGAGLWAAVDLFVGMRVMHGVEASNFPVRVFNGCYPDLVNEVVHDPRLGPESGVGNVTNMVPGVALAASEVLGVVTNRVSVKLVAHHAVSYTAPVTGDAAAPYILRIFLDGIDVTSTVDSSSVLRRMATRFRRKKGQGGESVAVSSALQILRPALTGRTAFGHAPGVQGLPGGCPVKVTAARVELDLPEDVSIESAVAVNREGARRDGIAEVMDDRTVVLTSKCAEIARKILGYDAEFLAPPQVEEKARELVERFDRLYAGS